MNSSILFILNKLSYSAITFLLIYLIAPSCVAQQNAQWPFYIAFEDATGAKDTMWMVFDSSAAYPNGVSPSLGEVPLSSQDTLDFHVWCNLYFGEQGAKYSTSAKSLSYSSNERLIYAANYVLPITARWDTLLFTADILYETGDPVNRATIDNNYFFLVNNWYFQVFEMTLDNHVLLPEFGWGGGVGHFPIFVDFDRGPLGPILNTDEKESDYFSLYPNPTAGLINIEFLMTASGTLTVYDSKGKLVLSENMSSDRKQIDLQNEADGLYYAVYQDDERRVVKKVVLRK